jgi:hypothetical protein
VKTAIISTDRFWKEDRVFELLPDARYFYLCLLTNPERNTTAAFKCSDRLMSAFTGYNIDTIKLCQRELLERGFIEIIEGYYIINDQDYVQPRRGKLSQQLFNKDFNSLPLRVREFIQARSSAALEYKDKDKNVDKNESVAKKDINEVSKLYHEIIKDFTLPVRNHNNLRSYIKRLESEVGKDKALEYLSFIKANYKNLNDDGFKPRLNEGMDIYSKRLAIQSWIQRVIASGQQSPTVGGRPIF